MHKMDSVWSSLLTNPNWINYFNIIIRIGMNFGIVPDYKKKRTVCPFDFFVVVFFLFIFIFL